MQIFALVVVVDQKVKFGVVMNFLKQLKIKHLFF